MKNETMNSVSEGFPNKPIPSEANSDHPRYCLKGVNLLSPKNKTSSETASQTHAEEPSVSESDSKPQLMCSTKIKSGLKKLFSSYISAILVIAFAVSSFFAVFFYIELRIAKKTISTYETEFSDALNMYKDLKNAVDQKMERRYELIHKKYPDISKRQFEKIRAIFAEQGNKDYTKNRLNSSFGYSLGMSRRIYELWYEA